MTDLMELFRHWHAGRSQVQISTALGIDRKTIRKYLAPASAAGLAPGEGGKFDEALWRDSSVLDRSPVPGTNRTLELRAGSVRIVLDHFCAEFHHRVEKLDEPERDDWGWAPPTPIPGSADYSNHGSGTAVDLNATRHPWGVRGTFTTQQVSEIRQILGELGEVVRWGGDYVGKVDEMHFEINAPTVDVENVARSLRLDEGSSGVTTLQRGSSGEAVRALQMRLNRDYPRYSNLVVDGIYGPATESVVREFQSRAGLTADGVAGPRTLARLGL